VGVYGKVNRGLWKFIEGFAEKLAGVCGKDVPLSTGKNTITPSPSFYSTYI
jgi:hypothetical protein